MLYEEEGTGHCNNKMLQNHSSQQTVFYKTNGRRCFCSPIRGKDSCSTCVRQTSEFYWKEEGKQLKFKNIPTNALCYNIKFL